MKISCNVIKDLLLIYGDESVSEDTRKLVEEHLESCEECRKYFDGINYSMEMANEIKNQDINEEKQTQSIKRGFAKIRKRWIVSIVLVVALVPVFIFGGRLTINQINQSGLRFTNIDEVLLCRKFIKAIEKHDFDKMYSLMDVTWNLEYLKEDYEMCSENKNMRDFESVTVDDEQFSVAKERDYSIDDISFWEDVIYNSRCNVLIPEHIWNTIVGKNVVSEECDWQGVEYELFYPGTYITTEDEFDVFENPGFLYMETEWGNYYTFGELIYNVDSYSCYMTADAIIDSRNDAVMLYRCMDVLPQSITEEAEKQIRTAYAEDAAYIQSTYGHILNMSGEEYTECYKEKYREAIEAFWAKKYSIVDISYIDKDQNVIDEKYDDTVVMHIELEDSMGNREAGKIVLNVKDGKISVSSVTWDGKMISELYEALNFIY